MKTKPLPQEEGHFGGTIYLSISFLFFSVLSLSFFRVIFLVYFQDRILLEGIYPELIKTLFIGAIKDLSVASTISLIYLCASLCFTTLRKKTNNLHQNYGDILCAISAFLFIATIFYFEEFNSHFHFVLFQMDAFETKSLVPILWHDYNIIFSILILIFSIYVLRFLLIKTKKTVNYHLNVSKGKKRKIILLAIYFFIIVFSYQSEKVYFIQLGIDDYATDSFLKETTQNPFSALLNSAYNFTKSGYPEKLEEFLPDGNIYTALSDIYPEASLSNNLDNYLEKKAHGASVSSPSHIFFIIMESYGTWPLKQRFESLHVTDKLKEIGEQGIWIKNLLPSGCNSSPSLTSLLTGLHFALDHPSLEQVYPTSPGIIFSNLGYTTRFFYGGGLDWNQIDRHYKTLGFEEAFGSDEIDQTSFAWKTSDQNLFNYINDVIRKKPEKPSFNMIFTTSNHVPLSVDLPKEGFPLKAIHPDVPITSTPQAYTRIGHLWYSDQQLGYFVKKTSEHFPNALFVIVGDHPSLNPMPTQPLFLETIAVPLVLYSKKLDLKKFHYDNLFGSHMDIVPTIVELIAPQGFIYHTTGNDILNRKELSFSVGFKSLITSDFIMDMRYPSTRHPFNRSAPQSSWQQKSYFRRMFNSSYAISWWRGTYGNELNQHTETAQATK